MSRKRKGDQNREVASAVSHRCCTSLAGRFILCGSHCDPNIPNEARSSPSLVSRVYHWRSSRVVSLRRDRRECKNQMGLAGSRAICGMVYRHLCGHSYSWVCGIRRSRSLGVLSVGLQPFCQDNTGREQGSTQSWIEIRKRASLFF